MCPIRSVKAYGAPSASWTSWPCAKSSISPTAASTPAGSGPASQGTGSRRGVAARPFPAAARHSSQCRSSSGTGSARRSARPAAMPASKSSRTGAVAASKAAGSRTPRSIRRLTCARCATWCRTVQPGAGVGAPHSPGDRPATSRASAVPSVARSTQTSCIAAMLAFPSPVKRVQSDPAFIFRGGPGAGFSMRAARPRRRPFRDVRPPPPVADFRYSAQTAIQKVRESPFGKTMCLRRTPAEACRPVGSRRAREHHAR